jgi:hypothetical protein
MLIKSKKEVKLSTRDQLNNEIALLIFEGKSRIVWLENLEFWDKQAAIDWYAYQLAWDENGKALGKEIGGKLRQSTAFIDWMNWKGRTSFKGVIFKPYFFQKDEKIANYKLLNIYKGMSVVGKQGNCSLILEHIFEIWCNKNESLNNYVLNWFSRMIQLPFLQAETALTFKSAEGVGKNIILDMFIDFFREHSTFATKVSDIVGNFNDHLALSVFVFLNESDFAKSSGAKGVVQSLITDKFLTMHKKFLPKTKIKNCTHLVICSNNDFYADLNVDDRRFITLLPSSTKKGDFIYFKNLADEIESGGNAAFLDYLAKRDISNFNPRVFPEFSAEIKEERGKIKLLNQSSILQWSVDFLDSKGDNLFDKNNWKYDFVKVTKSNLLDNYLQYCKTRNLIAESNVTFYKKVIEIFSLSMKRLGGKKMRVNYYIFKDFAACEENLKCYFNNDNPF